MNYLSIIKNIEMTSCPHCNSGHICRYGYVKDRQRYKCKECSRTFNSYTNKPWNNSKLNISLWNRYLSLMNNKLTLSECARILHINIKTAFSLRHKIMMAVQVQQNLLHGEVEIIKRTYYENRKGSKNISSDKKKFNIHFGLNGNGNTFLDLDVRPMSIQLVKDVIRRNINSKAFIVPSNNRFVNLAIKTFNSAIKNSVIKCLNACKEFKYYELWHKDFRGIATKYIYRYYYWYKNNKNIKYMFYAACI